MKNAIIIILIIAVFICAYSLGRALKANIDEEALQPSIKERCPPCYDSTFISEKVPLTSYYIRGELITQVVCGYDSFIVFNYNDSINFKIYYTGSIDSIIYNSPLYQKRSYYPWYK